MSDDHVDKLVTIPLEEAKRSLKMSFITAADAAPHSALSRMETQKIFFSFLGPKGPN